MRAPLPWLREYVAVPADATGEQVAADLVRVGLEEEAVHGGEVTGPLVVPQPAMSKAARLLTVSHRVRALIIASFER